MSPHLKGRGQIVFGVDPIGIDVSIGIGIGMTLSCLHNILWTSGWILTKFSWICNWDITQKKIRLVDLDLIFKVTAVEKLKILWRFLVFTLPFEQFWWGNTCFLWKHCSCYFNGIQDFVTSRPKICSGRVFMNIKRKGQRNRSLWLFYKQIVVDDIQFFCFFCFFFIIFQNK